MLGGELGLGPSLQLQPDLFDLPKAASPAAASPPPVAVENEQSRVIDKRNARSLSHPSRRGRCLRKLDPVWPFPMGRRELPAQDGCESWERERREIMESLAVEMSRGLAAVARHPRRGGQPIEHQSKRQCAESDCQEQALVPSSRLANASSRWQELSVGRRHGGAPARPRRSGPGRPISTRGLHRRHHGALSGQTQGRLQGLSRQLGSTTGKHFCCRQRVSTLEISSLRLAGAGNPGGSTLRKHVRRALRHPESAPPRWDLVVLPRRARSRW